MALKVKRMTEQALAGKRVLIREDLNVPVKDGKVTSTARIDAALPTLRPRSRRARASWSCRTSAGRRKASPIPPRRWRPSPPSSASCWGARCRSQRIGSSGVDVAPGELVLCENVRF